MNCDELYVAMFTVKPREDFLSEKETYNRLHRQQFFDFCKEYSKVSAVWQGATLDVSFREVFVLLSPPQRLLLVNTSERKIRERKRWREKTAARGTMGRGKKRELLLSLFSLPRVPHAL